MNRDDQMFLRRVPMIAIGVFAVGLAACGPKPATEQESVDAGRIVEQMPGPAAGSAADPEKNMEKDSIAQFAQFTDDILLTAQVQVALNADPALKLLPITVHTAEGVVTLSGPVGTETNRDQAEQVTMNVSGVKSVDNQLAVDNA